MVSACLFNTMVNGNFDIDTTRILPELARHGELGSPILHLLFERRKRGRGVIQDGVLEVLEFVGGVALFDILRNLDTTVHEFDNLLEVTFNKAACRHGGCPHTQPVGLKSRLVAGHGVLVAVDVGELEHTLDACTVNVLVAQIDKDQMVLGTARHEGVALRLERISHSSTVLNHLLLVRLELRRACSLERNSECSDGVVVGATLQARENSLVDFVLVVVHDIVALLVGALETPTEEDQGAAGATQRLVRGCRDDVSILEGRYRHHASSHET
mmetsp:Transcript_95753/g.154420  ORF Transcript_95753/g.154420 Transcript_95753/m.154420 type:complete len:271 (-) Transcript_95753:764-1576(-)